MPTTGPEPLPRVDPAEAIAFFRAKGWEIAFDWRDVWQEENVRAFTVAKAMSRDLLEDIRAAVDSALADGTTLEQFAKDLRPKLQARGWWGRKLMEDPSTGEIRVVQLGSPARLRTIYETNLRTSYMAGRWQRIERAKAVMPYIRYVSVMDGREREQHHAWHGTILPVDDPWWDTHFPPCGWGCRCDGQPVNRRMIERRGWKIEPPQKFRTRTYVNKRTGEVTTVEAGIDPGWGYNVGKASLDGMTPSPRATGDMGELNAASFSDGEFSKVKAFFGAFGLESRAAALKGKIWQDAAGWPMAISLGLLRGPRGRMVKLGAQPLRALSIAARVLLQPDTIGWLWVKGEDGRALLVRRYVSAEGAVDIGGPFWRWSAGGTKRLATGNLVWSADGGELAAFNPHQPRDKSGRWSRGYGSATTFAKTAMNGTPIGTRMNIAPLPPHARRELARLGLQGVDPKGQVKEVALDSSLLRHVNKRHAADHRTQAPITADDILKTPALLRVGKFNHGTPRITAGGAPVVHVTGLVDGTRYEGAFEVRKHTVAVKSLRKEK